MVSGPHWYLRTKTHPKSVHKAYNIFISCPILRNRVFLSHPKLLFFIGKAESSTAHPVDKNADSLWVILWIKIT